MSDGFWNGQTRKESGAFYEKAFQRGTLAKWDTLWAQLSPKARRIYLDDVKGPVKTKLTGRIQPSVSAEAYPSGPLQELVDAGFVNIEPSKTPGKPPRVSAEVDAADFARRVRAVRRLKVLTTDLPESLNLYLDSLYARQDLISYASVLLEGAGINRAYVDFHTVTRYIKYHHWSEWILKGWGDAPIAEKVLHEVQKAQGPVPINDLALQVKNVDPKTVRRVIDRLVTHLALVEDLDPETLDIVVDFLPEVRSGRARALERTTRPELEVCEKPAGYGPEGGLMVEDLRAFLLELASEPARLRQDGTIFNKEEPRFLSAFTELPEWYITQFVESRAGRLRRMATLAAVCKLTTRKSQGKALYLELTSKGQDWLSSSLKSQYEAIYSYYRDTSPQSDYYINDNALLNFSNDVATIEHAMRYARRDELFLGSDVIVVKIEGKTNVPRNGKDKKASTPASPRIKRPKEGHLYIKTLREALGQAFMKRPVGVFHRLDRLTDHLTFGDHNILLMGQGQKGVLVDYRRRPVPPLEEEREAVATEVITGLIRLRLVPLGCLVAAIDDGGRICVARTERLGAYFGLEPMPEGPATAGGNEASKVVIQPDFSVVVIGLDTAALAELSPFCDRTTRGGVSAGASVLKITRESVVRAVANGVKPSEIVNRLRKHASHEPPPNVLHEIKEWTGWVRKIRVESIAVLRCPDRETTDRAVSILRGQGVRLNDTLVAIESKRMTAADRKKFKDQGLIVEGAISEPDTSPKKRKKPSYRW